MHAYMTTTTEVSKMQSALAKTGQFSIEKTAETIRAVHTKSKILVLAGLRKGSSSNVWIMRQHAQLFS